MTGAAERLRSIGVVAYEMEGEPTGVGRYVEELLLALRRTPGAEGWRLRLFFKGEGFAHPLWMEPGTDGCRFEPVFDGRPNAHPILWEQFRLPVLLRRQPVDVLFSPSYSLPRGPRRPSLVTIHDLAYEHLPRDFRFRERWRRRYLARQAARSATRVLTDTRRTAAELRQRYGVPDERIAVAPLGVSPRFDQARESAKAGRASRVDQALARVGVRAPYVLVIGSMLARRRLDLVLDALGRLLGEPPPVPAGAVDALRVGDLSVVIAGRNQLPRREDLDRWIDTAGLAERVIQLGYVDDDLLPGLYAHAHGTIYVSEYEGYGLPPLESLAAGVPVLVSDAPALTELWPNYPLQCDRLDFETLTNGLERLLFDPGARESAISEAPRRLRSMTWERAAERFATEVETAWRTALGPMP